MRTSVTFVIPNLYGGGTEYQLYEVCRALARFPDLRLRVCSFYSDKALALPGYYDAVRGLGVEVDTLFDEVVTGAVLLRALTKYLRDHRPDVIQSFLEANHHCLLTALGVRSRFFVGIRSEWTASPQLALLYRVLGWRIEGFVANSRRAIAGVSDQLRVPVHKCHVIYNGFDAARFDGLRSRADTRRQIGLAEDSHVFVNVSNMHFVAKGHEDLLRAFAQHLTHHPADALLLVGDGIERSALEGTARALGCHERVHFLGWRSDVIDILAAADTYVSPSWREGLSNSMAEALLTGLPIIATDTGAAAELLELGRGVLVPPRDHDALVAAMRTRISPPTGAEVARARAALSTDRLGEQYASLYR